MNYAKVSEVRPDTVLIADGGFTCLEEGAELTVIRDELGLFVPCEEGNHYLDGQLDDGDEYIGLSLKS